ncbi:MAG: hypothetical protein WCP39_06085 [Chlamydiota bacterium]
MGINISEIGLNIISLFSMTGCDNRPNLGGGGNGEGSKDVLIDIV